MRVLINTMHPAPYFDRLSSELKNKGLDVEMWYFRNKSANKLWKTYVPEESHFYRELSWFNRIKYFSKFDLVILAWTPKNYSLALFLRILGVKYGFYLDHPDPEVTKTGWFSRMIKTIFMRYLSPYMFPASYSCADILINCYKVKRHRCKVFPYTHSEAGKCIASINDCRQTALGNGAPIKILIANRFIPRKGYDVVYKAFEVLGDRIKEFEIQVVGGGVLYDEYFSKFTSLYEGINVFNWVENNEYENMLNQTDVYIHSSHFEPFGIPPLDAMERSKYVIVTNNVKSTDVFVNKCGVAIYKHDDAEALAEILLNVIRLKNDLYKITSENVCLAKEYYSIDVNYNSIMSCI